MQLKESQTHFHLLSQDIDHSLIVIDRWDKIDWIDSIYLPDIRIRFIKNQDDDAIFILALR